MQDQMDNLLRILYGRKSERFILKPINESQLSLFQQDLAIAEQTH